MSEYIKQEYDDFFHNKKNIVLYLLVGLLTLFFVIQLEPSYKIHEATNFKNLESSYLDKKQFLETVNLDGDTHPRVLEAVAAFNIMLPTEKKRYESLKSNHLAEYAASSAIWYGFGTSYNPSYYTYGNDFAKFENTYGSSSMIPKMTEYAKRGNSLSMNELNERTAWQQVERLMKRIVPMLFSLLAILFSIDLLSKDRKHSSLIDGYPISLFRRMMIKLIVTMSGLFLVIIPLGIGFIIVGLRRGFGSIHLPSSYSVFPVEAISNLESTFHSQTIGLFLVKSSLLLLLLVFLIMLVSLLISYWSKNDFLNLVMISCITFSSLLYQRHGLGDIYAIQYSPMSYLFTGDVVSGYQGFFWSTPFLTYNQGLMVVGISIGVFIVITKLSTIKKRQI
ncbi:hypothetical protein [Vagococcus bubulae]|uniref:Uncharacterized protein n=1 Tax=Vagococcus bubulae TaxID=1977868 RepID=A0A429ZET7_9ENTE|nr:hypothetical protein [Vagococcus bubulae]RST92226.1 hypothetical protein CBF36_09070 [Vagococcus bubulae]